MLQCILSSKLFVAVWRICCHLVNTHHAYHVAIVSTRQVKNPQNCQKMSKFFNFVTIYLETLWEMHSYKYKHTWYWFSNNMKQALNLKNLRKENTLLHDETQFVKVFTIAAPVYMFTEITVTFSHLVCIIM